MEAVFGEVGVSSPQAPGATVAAELVRGIRSGLLDLLLPAAVGWCLRGLTLSFLVGVACPSERDNFEEPALDQAHSLIQEVELLDGLNVHFALLGGLFCELVGDGIGIEVPGVDH